MVQPYLGDAEETALVYIDGAYSHAAAPSRAAAGGGRPRGLLPRRGARPGEAAEPERAVAEAALACAPGELALRPGRPARRRVLELEVTEPSLYLAFGDGRRGRASPARASPLSRLGGRLALVTCRDGRPDTLRPAAARPAHLGHRPLQLPLRLLHAEGGLRARLRVPRPRASCSRSRRSSGSRASSSRTASRRSGSPAASRSSAATSSGWSRMLAAIGGLDLTLTTNGVAARRRRRRRSRDAGPDARHRQPRLARRRGLPRDERRRLPGRSACSTGSTRPRPPGCRSR